MTCTNCGFDLTTGHQSSSLNLCQTCYDWAEQENHACAGDNCVCIGGDEDKSHRDTDYGYEDDSFLTDAEADALASAGWGTDEDYGYFGDD